MSAGNFDTNDPNVPAVTATSTGTGGTTISASNTSDGSTTISASNTGGPVGKNPSTAISASATGAFGIAISAYSTGNGIQASAATDGTAVWGSSGSGQGILGQSALGTGIQANSDQGTALVAHSGSSTAIQASSDSGGTAIQASNNSSDPAAAAIAASSPNGYGIRGEGGNIGVYAHNLTAPTAVYLATRGLAGDFTGDVAVKGNIAASGNVTVAGDVILTGADCAEEFDVAETVDIEPGTVLVLDQDGALHQSQQAYDKRVAGVVSGAGDYRPGLILDRRQSRGSRAPVALVGKVYCKVDAQYGAIEVGDLLTTSPTPGHAMKAADPFKAFGSVIGKALRPLKAGQETIPILIALQ